MSGPSTFPERFDFAREFQRWHGAKESDRAFAAALGVSAALISGWRGGSSGPPPIDRCLAIAERCGVDPGWLAFGEKSEAPAPDGFRTARRKAPGLRVAEPGAVYGDPDATSTGKREA